MLAGELRTQFEDLHTAGMAAKRLGNHHQSLSAFEAADQLAAEYGDDRKRLDALQPAAQDLWSMGQYDEAALRLTTAGRIAGELGLSDEQGIILSNLGRLGAVKAIHSVPEAWQRQGLKAEASPRFRAAFETLKGHPHLYYRYANAQHGSLTSALAGERLLTARLVAEGLRVAFRHSPEPYEQQRPYRTSPSGLIRMAAATALLPFADRTPVLAQVARQRLVS